MRNGHTRNVSISNGSKSWVTEQTSLTGGVVDIDVEKKTTLTGAVIASTTNDLTLETGSIEYSNLKDNDTSNTIGGGLNVSSNTGSMTASYKFGDKRQTNFATIGVGTVTVHDSSTGSVTGLEGLNRDVTLSQYNTKNAELKGGFTVDTTMADLLVNTVDQMMGLATHPVDTILDDYNKAKDGYDKLYQNSKYTVVNIVDKTVSAVEKTSNWVDNHLSSTDEEGKSDNTENTPTIDSESSNDTPLDANQDLANQKLDEGKLKPVNIGGKDIVGVKEGGIPGNNNPPINQHTLDANASGTACTFSVWNMIAGYFGEATSLNDTYQNTPDSVIRKSDGWVYSQEGIIEAAGVPGVKVTTYNEKDAGKSTQIMVNSLNDGAKIHLRVSSDTSTHSVVVDGYGFDANGKLYMNVRDPDSINRYKYYDPATKQLYNPSTNGRRDYDKRQLTRFETAEKK